MSDLLNRDNEGNVLCTYCNKLMGANGVIGTDDLLYCSAHCARLAENPSRVWWVCRMKGGGHFSVGDYDPPSGVIYGRYHSIAADNYDVVYGPCSYEEAEEYMSDVSGAV